MNQRIVGTVSMGIRCPIIKEGDDLATIISDTVLQAQENGELTIKDRDVLAMTESIVARAQGNYCSIDDISADVKAKTGGGTIGVIFPIESRNRFAICLRGISKAAEKVVLMFSYPTDEVGNSIMDIDDLYESDINPYKDILDLDTYRNKFGVHKHRFTGMDYVEYYSEIIRECGAEPKIIFANQPQAILSFTKKIIACDIHTRNHTKDMLKKCGGEVVLGLDDIMNAPVGESGYNADYGLLGSNKATEDKVKLFPRDAQPLVNEIQAIIRNKTGKNIEVMVYGDGAFKDPVGKIWELADPVVSPFHTDGLIGTPNEIKIKYLADNQYEGLTGEELKSAIKASIEEKDSNLVGNMASEGTTPRQLTDLIGSLCDLTSGSGDKGTPVVLVQGYFDNYAS